MKPQCIKRHANATINITYGMTGSKYALKIKRSIKKNKIKIAKSSTEITLLSDFRLTGYHMHVHIEYIKIINSIPLSSSCIEVINMR